uniref:Uncharacterized protein n=1 Tax=Candidozyma auris TaxID=498019 RepID=A0A0L0NMN7_CANAR
MPLERWQLLTTSRQACAVADFTVRVAPARRGVAARAVAAVSDFAPSLHAQLVETLAWEGRAT